jgi:phospholipid/cholesterol/gamma-HCH transport system permease protein
VKKLRFFLTESGEMFGIGIEAVRNTWDVKHWWTEYVEQCLFLVKVTVLPVMLVAIPIGATVSLQIGDLTRQLGAESATGAAVILGIIREASPLAASLLIAGAGGSAMTSDMGARNIRDELAAMEVMAVNPVHRLVTPRLWAAATISVLLVPLVIVAGIGGGFFFNVVIQGVSPGAYFGTASSLLQTADLLTALLKAFLFGLIAGMVACYKGMNCDRSPVGVGLAVKQGLVITFMLVFFVNYVITTLYYVLIPQKVG